MKPLIRLGHIDLSFHAASAAVVQRILEAHGYSVVSSASPHEEMFQRYGAGEVDMLVSAWLPDSHGGYLAPYAHETRYLGVLYQPYCIWGVPDYVPVDKVASVSDLLRPEIAARMSHLIQGINPGAGISRFSRAMIEQYGLGAAGYHFENGTQEDCFKRFENAVEHHEWVVVPLWHPQFLHHRFSIRPLSEPKGLLGGQDDATLIVKEHIALGMPDELLERLTRLTLGNAVISELDHLICREGLTPLAAADIWLGRARS
ncbi:glycine betaine ABC transporter substrate-binding protein [Pseudomonas sp. LS-2]|jgi:glycine betaine/proline transport system substrate-binding protein|uniref:glycine betaine ABC transporter substrate-binding protein n=1 Tax=Pseudomonas sp. LS-2 TaxID=2315859 RepID=UPI000E736918|nr:glycine betaine ABC transporter substrate-binding protein [Pseudomonas sp. LS-2]RJX83371.1 glycine/betaine ABC transporter substrate-binding protein [Pseudomonas sp. LS-2]